MSIQRLVGKVAIVTGSTAGIGFSIASRLAKEGASVIVSSRKQENVDRAIKKIAESGGCASGIVCNVSSSNDRLSLINHCMETYDKIDILVSNVGTNPHFGPLVSCSEEMWTKIFFNNVTCSSLLSSLALPHLEKSQGNIVFVSSVTGYTPAPFIGAYSVSKAALISLTKALSMEVARSKVRVNCIAPGVIETDFSSALTTNEDLVKSTLKTIPMRRFGKADECAGAVAFLASDDASYITGETVSMDGGMPVRF